MTVVVTNCFNKIDQEKIHKYCMPCQLGRTCHTMWPSGTIAVCVLGYDLARDELVTSL